MLRARGCQELPPVGQVLNWAVGACWLGTKLADMCDVGQFSGAHELEGARRVVALGALGVRIIGVSV